MAGMLLPALLALLVLDGSVLASVAASRQPSSSVSKGSQWLQSVWDGLRLPAPHASLRTGVASPRNSNPVPQGVQWALLVAGSNGWWNYRHQADVLHSYQVLVGGGLHPDRIVLMVYDDIASNPSNPFPGQVFNRPGGPDVYAGAVIDYKGNAVNADTVLAVLLSNATAVKGQGSGKVIASGPDDHVFMFFSDHGSPGVLGMPSGNFLFADDLLGTIRRKHQSQGYKEMTLYIEACESGSMFEGLLGPELNVYATTAANAEESSWGTYCPGMDIPAEDATLDTCMGDLYSVAWMEDTECEDTDVETLKDQFDLVRLRTSRNDTFNMGSHVMQYGRMAMQGEHVSQYLGPRDASACQMPSEQIADITPSQFPSSSSSSPWASVLHWLLPQPASSPALTLAGNKKHGRPSTSQCPAGKRCNPLRASAHKHHVQQRDADLVPLRAKVVRAHTHEQRRAAQVALDREVTRRQQVDAGLQAATARLLTLPAASHTLMSALGWRPQRVFSTAATAAAGDNRMTPDPTLVQQLLTSPTLMGRGQGSGKALVDSWACLKGMVAAYSGVCAGGMDQYAMKHTRLFANLCNAGVQPEQLATALQLTGGCPAPSQAAAAVAQDAAQVSVQ